MIISTFHAVSCCHFRPLAIAIDVITSSHHQLSHPSLSSDFHWESFANYYYYYFDDDNDFYCYYYLYFIIVMLFYFFIILLLLLLVVVVVVVVVVLLSLSFLLLYLFCIIVITDATAYRILVNFAIVVYKRQYFVISFR